MSSFVPVSVVCFGWPNYLLRRMYGSRGNTEWPFQPDNAKFGTITTTLTYIKVAKYVDFRNTTTQMEKNISKVVHTTTIFYIVVV